MSKALMLVFVVDASRPQRFPVAKQHLHELLASEPCLPLMVLANKQVSVTAKHSNTKPLLSDQFYPHLRRVDINNCSVTQTHLFLCDLLIFSMRDVPYYQPVKAFKINIGSYWYRGKKYRKNMTFSIKKVK